MPRQRVSSFIPHLKPESKCISLTLARPLLIHAILVSAACFLLIHMVEVVRLILIFLLCVIPNSPRVLILTLEVVSALSRTWEGSQRGSMPTVGGDVS